jgi:hypothetical protein
VQIEQAGRERHSLSVDAARVGWRFYVRPDCLDAVAANNDSLLRRLDSSSVNYGCAYDGDYIFVVLFAGVGGNKAGAKKYYDGQQQAFHQVSSLLNDNFELNFGDRRQSSFGHLETNVNRIGSNVQRPPHLVMQLHELGRDNRRNYFRIGQPKIVEIEFKRFSHNDYAAQTLA